MLAGWPNILSELSSGVLYSPQANTGIVSRLDHKNILTQYLPYPKVCHLKGNFVT
jgi:hypothetical protein